MPIRHRWWTSDVLIQWGGLRRGSGKACVLGCLVSRWCCRHQCCGPVCQPPIRAAAVLCCQGVANPAAPCAHTDAACAASAALPSPVVTLCHVMQAFHDAARAMLHAQVCGLEGGSLSATAQQATTPRATTNTTGQGNTGGNSLTSGTRKQRSRITGKRKQSTCALPRVHQSDMRYANSMHCKFTSHASVADTCHLPKWVLVLNAICRPAAVCQCCPVSQATQRWFLLVCAAGAYTPVVTLAGNASVTIAYNATYQACPAGVATLLTGCDPGATATAVTQGRCENYIRVILVVL
jgi:hypothetical protein